MSDFRNTGYEDQCPSTGPHGGQSYGIVLNHNTNALGLSAFHADGARGATGGRTEEEEVALAKRRAGMV